MSAGLDMMTENRMKMLTTLKTCGDCTIQELADAADVAYQTAWRWIEQQIDIGNVEKIYYGANTHDGRKAARFSLTGDEKEQAATLLYRAKDYLEIALIDDAHACRLANDIGVWMTQNDAMSNAK